DKICAAVTMTGNRIEWNRNGGINLVNASSHNITGNYFDRSYGPAVSLRGLWFPCNNVTFTGNIFNRSGKYKSSFENDKYENSHLYFDNCQNLAVSGNTFLTGKDDFGESAFSPDYGIVMKRLSSCAITGNTMYGGAMREKLVDLGDHGSENCIFGNAGTAFDQSEKPGNGTY
ncbi:MAG: right-handed parallel beta-helix repeat-containing protein, partial [Clostridia bacterium]|nr:right-handed parallel beta-helix repeat-containing protein [Clostridia bacterium]